MTKEPNEAAEISVQARKVSSRQSRRATAGAELDKQAQALFPSFPQELRLEVNPSVRLACRHALSENTSYD